MSAYVAQVCVVKLCVYGLSECVCGQCVYVVFKMCVCGLSVCVVKVCVCVRSLILHLLGYRGSCFIIFENIIQVH